MFHKCNTIEEVKTLYRKLAMRLHPDHGGEAHHMVLLQESYEMAMAIKEEKPIPKPSTGKKYETAYEDIFMGDDRATIIKDIQNYAREHVSLDTKFVNSVEEYALLKGKITSSQYNALVRIYYSFRMDEKEE